MKLVVVIVMLFLVRSMIKNDEYYIKIAIKEAQKAFIKKEVPVGAVLVKDNKIIARAHNLIETKNNALYHAEINVINKAIKKLGQKFLNDSILYVTLEPCLMCAGAIQLARIKKVVYSAKEPKFGCLSSQGNAYQTFKGNHNVEIVGGLLEEVTSKMMKDFFIAIRDSKL